MATAAENQVSLARMRRRQSARQASKDADFIRPSSVTEVLENTTDHLIHIMSNQHANTSGKVVLEGSDITRDREQISAAENFAVVIHHTDEMRASIHLHRPVVRVSVIDAGSGKYVKKTWPDLCAVSFYEKQNETVDYILPIQTQPFNPGSNTSAFRPVWEESLVINEDLLKLNQEIVFFFEILALPSCYSNWVKERQAQSWHKIAWSFLRPTRKSLLGKRCRLQLYVYPNQQAEAYPVWATRKMVTYPSTLYITLKTVTLQTPVETAQRSMCPYQQEEGNVPLEQLISLTQPSSGVSMPVDISAPPTSLSHPHTPRWSRLPGQSCEVPNRVVTLLQPGLQPQGCSSLAFSSDGRLLACAGVTAESYPVSIWETSSWTLVLSSGDHRGLVYGFSWCPNSTLVATASADCVCRVWSMKRLSPPVTLPHPCYVYTVQFAGCFTVCTGAFDGCLRVWRLCEGDSASLVAELREHSSRINCMALEGGRSLLYSCDSSGRMCVWSTEDQPLLQRKVKVTEGDSALQIILHSSGKKALVRTTATLVMFDLRIDRVVYDYTLSLMHTCSLLSPCGSLVFSGNKDGCLYAWRTDTSETRPLQVTCLQRMNAISSMAYHPIEHVIVVGTMTSHQPVAVLAYENSLEST